MRPHPLGLNWKPQLTLKGVVPAEPSATSQRDRSGLTQLRSQLSVRPAASSQAFSQNTSAISVPKFLVKSAPGTDSWWGALKVLFAPSKRIVGKHRVLLFRTPSMNRARRQSYFVSIAVHAACIAALFYLHNEFPIETVQARTFAPERIYYPVPIRDTAKTMPRLAPAGPGGHPGEGPKLEVPALGSTATLKNLTAVSKPARPDNKRQTIWQRNSPPDLRIQTDVKLPMILPGNPDIPKPKINFDPTNAKPIQAKKQYGSQTAPLDAPTQAPIATAIMPTVAQPQLMIPSGTYATPVRADNGHGQSQASGAAPDVAAGGDSRDLLAIGIDPAAAGSKVTLPPGNRWGDFSVSPNGGQPGSPGGSPGGVVGGGGSGKEGTGGDGSVGLGHGNSGGGGGNSTNTLPVSVEGRGGVGNGDGTLTGPPITPEDMVVPVISMPNIRKNETVVASGPVGGGGLAEYNALTCGKIYTIFVKMPGASWNLEYCPHGAAVQNTASADVRSTVIHMDQALLPPQPTAKFDFMRLPVPEGKRRKLIVLKAVIGEDGAVSDVEVYRGLVPEMDEAARLALSRWKFMPAIRGGKPVAVDILVGIQSASPVSP